MHVFRSSGRQTTTLTAGTYFLCDIIGKFTDISEERNCFAFKIVLAKKW
jgi:hypothetical protein